MRRILWGLGLLLSGPASADVHFSASLSDIQTDHEFCDTFFAVENYEVQHFWTGPTGRTSVMHLDVLDAEEETAAFFHNTTWVGRYGPDGDLYYEKRYGRDQYVVDFLGDGFLDYNVMYL